MSDGARVSQSEPQSPPLRASTNESSSPDYPHIAAGNLTVPSAEWPSGLIASAESAVLRSDPDRSPDFLPSPKAKQAGNHVNDVVVLDGERGMSFARSPFSYRCSVDH